MKLIGCILIVAWAVRLANFIVQLKEGVIEGRFLRLFRNFQLFNQGSGFVDLDSRCGKTN
jgi:hypothetical protein